MADFGSSALLRPRRPHVVISSYTGVTRTVSAQNGGDGGLQRAVVAEAITVGRVDAHGTMTKAVGTLLWMAPEMFRGDEHYGSAVDVFSFGIVLWEVCTPPHTHTHTTHTHMSTHTQVQRESNIVSIDSLDEDPPHVSCKRPW